MNEQCERKGFISLKLMQMFGQVLVTRKIPSRGVSEHRKPLKSLACWSVSYNNKRISEYPPNKDPRTSSDWTLEGRACSWLFDCLVNNYGYKLINLSYMFHCFPQLSSRGAIARAGLARDFLL